MPKHNVTNVFRVGRVLTGDLNVMAQQIVCCPLNPTIVLVVLHYFLFPDEKYVIVVQSSKIVPSGYKPFAKIANVVS